MARSKDPPYFEIIQGVIPNDDPPPLADMDPSDETERDEGDLAGGMLQPGEILPDGTTWYPPED